MLISDLTPVDLAIATGVIGEGFAPVEGDSSGAPRSWEQARQLEGDVIRALKSRDADVAAAFDTLYQMASTLPESVSIEDIADPIGDYLRAKTREEVERCYRDLVEHQPSVADIVMGIWDQPGVEAQERAIDLLASMGARTLRYANDFERFESYLRPFLANATWELVLGAIGLIDGKLAPYCYEFALRATRSANPVKRLAAYDALEALSESVSSP